MLIIWSWRRINLAIVCKSELKYQNKGQEKGCKGGIYDEEGEDKKEMLITVVCFSGRHGGKPKKIK